MSIGLFGRKIGMTQIFADDGTAVPVTLVQAETCQVSQLKTIDTDSYNAIQVSYVEQAVHKLTKPQAGHLKKSGTKGFKYSGRFRLLGQCIRDQGICKIWNYINNVFSEII